MVCCSDSCALPARLDSKAKDIIAGYRIELKERYRLYRRPILLSVQECSLLFGPGGWVAVYSKLGSIMEMRPQTWNIHCYRLLRVLKP